MGRFFYLQILKHLLLVILAWLGFAFIALPHLPASWAGNYIFLSLLSVPFVLVLAATCVALFTPRFLSDWRWIFAILTLGGLGVLWNHVPTGTYTPSDPQSSIRLLSWNVTNFHIRPDTLHQAAAYIRNLNPDVICLQERPHENLISWDSIRAAFPEYPYAIRNEQREDEVLNLAILSKYPLDKARETYYADTYNKTLSVEVHASKPFHLWNTHLQTTGHLPTHFIGNAKRRNAQADSLKLEINRSQLPTIVCGDFNDTPCSYTYRRLEQGMQDAYRQASRQWTGSYQPLGSWLRIDYILCSDHWAVQSYELLENPWSDHKMQFAILKN